jgi:hypothetical protein
MKLKEQREKMVATDSEVDAPTSEVVQVVETTVLEITTEREVLAAADE